MASAMEADPEKGEYRRSEGNIISDDGSSNQEQHLVFAQPTGWTRVYYQPLTQVNITAETQCSHFFQ